MTTYIFNKKQDSLAKPHCTVSCTGLAQLLIDFRQAVFSTLVINSHRPYKSHQVDFMHVILKYKVKNLVIVEHLVHV